MEDFAGGCCVHLMMMERLEFQLSDLEAENATLKGDYLW
jgi:hypothetical protein